jgi:hypothetical protein
MDSISSKSIITIDPHEHDSYIFVKKEDLENIDVVANNKMLLKNISTKKFNFEEYILKE